MQYTYSAYFAYLHIPQFSQFKTVTVRLIKTWLWSQLGGIYIFFIFYTLYIFLQSTQSAYFAYSHNLHMLLFCIFCKFCKILHMQNMTNVHMQLKNNTHKMQNNMQIMQINMRNMEFIKPYAPPLEFAGTPFHVSKTRNMQNDMQNMHAPHFYLINNWNMNKMAWKCWISRFLLQGYQQLVAQE